MIKNPLRSSIRYREGIPILPGDFPVVGHMPTFFLHTPEAFQEGKRAVGPLFWIRAINDSWTLIWAEKESLELLKNKVTTSDALDSAGDPLNFIASSMVAIDGPPHQHVRSAMKGPFTPRGIEVNQIGVTTAAMIEERVRRWVGKQNVPVVTETRELALDIIFRVTGIRVPDLSEWRFNYRELALAPIPIRVDLPGFPLYRARKAQEWVNQRLLELINEVRREGEAQDKSSGLLSAMVHGKDDNGQGLSDPELLQNLRLLLLAGHETTAATMAWVVIQLAQRGDLWDALVEEAKKATVLPTSPAELRSYPLSEGLFREAVRLYPPLGTLPRKTTASITIREHRIPPGTLISPCIVLLSRDEELYPNPERFDPLRWKDRTPSPLETCQFGGGPHFCMGYHLAWMEVVQFCLALAREMTRAGHRPQLSRGRPPRPIYFPLTHPPSSAKIQFS